MRKTRRKIRRRKRGKKRQPKRVSHFDTPITNRWTKMTTYMMLIFEFVFVIWWLQETLLNWEELTIKLRMLFAPFVNVIQMLIDFVSNLGGV